jgi:hypothetical protein
VTQYPNLDRGIRWAKKVFRDDEIRSEWWPILGAAAARIAKSGGKPTRAGVIERVRDQYGEELCDDYWLPVS